jgi:5-methyltetrahydrofolate--homocysteine methyltransferase
MSSTHAPAPTPSKTPRPFKLIGELINNSFARAARAWNNRDVAGFQQLARLQTDLGADYLTLNIDGTQTMRVSPQDMHDFLPDLIPAIQEVTSIPISFDNPSVAFHKRSLEIYDRRKSGRPILNSVAASRTHLDEMLELAKQYDTMVIGMASEKFVQGGGAQCLSADDVYGAAQQLVDLIRTKSGMWLIRSKADLNGVHMSVGLTNFSFGMPRDIRESVESAYLTLAVEAGLDFVLGNPEKNLHLLDKNDRFVTGVSQALEAGRPRAEETQEEAGFRQAEKIIGMFND